MNTLHDIEAQVDHHGSHGSTESNANHAQLCLAKCYVCLAFAFTQAARFIPTESDGSGARGEKYAHGKTGS